MAGVRSSFRLRVAGVFAASVVLIALAPPGATGAVLDPAISLRPHHGPPTTRTEVHGTGFGPTEEVVITFDAKQVGAAATDGAGSFSTRVIVPGSAKPGRHRVTATGQPSGLSASARFIVRTDWRDFRRDRANSGFNPYENVIRPSNVNRLQAVWRHPTGNLIYASPLPGRR
jgi:hypothetical protein